MYSVYFDNILQDEKDIININDVMQTSIVRQDGFDSQSQIIREKSDATLEFTGVAYQYVCDTLNDNPCHVFNVRIEETCGYIYNATMSIIGIERNLSNCIAKTDLKDNSFSAYIDGYIDTAVNLFNTKTKNCEPLAPIIQQFAMSYDVTDITLTKSISGFDVLDVFKFIIAYYTDNKIQLVSDFLTTNKYAITTGYNMHNHGFALIEKYPSLSFNDLFSDVRKKLRIYMAIEYDSFGNPYLRIEQESYFFEDTQLFVIDEIPKGSFQTYDNKRNFNEIKIGSKTFKVQENTPVTYPQLRYTAWNEESYGKCGSCVGEKNNTLDLVSDYIIDSNVFIEALIFNKSDDYSNDSSTFLFNYKQVASGGSGTIAYYNTGVMTLDSVTGDYYYNDRLRNENVLANYLEYYRECIEVQRNSSYAFLATKDAQTMNVTDALGYVQNYIEWATYFLDNQTSLSNVTHDFGAGADNLTIFTTQKDNQYSFKATLLNIYQRYSTPSGLNIATPNVTYQLFIRVYQDNTFGSLLSSYTTSTLALNAVTDKKDLALETGLISLVVGNVVCVEFIVSYPVGVNPGDVVVFSPDLVEYELLDDSDSCKTITTQQNNLPYLLNIPKTSICFSDYNTSNQNKKGYILVAGTKQWFREFNYFDKKNSSLILMSNDFIMPC